MKELGPEFSETSLRNGEASKVKKKKQMSGREEGTLSQKGGKSIEEPLVF